MKNDLRNIALNEGTGMDGTMYVFKTNAPVERLKALEKECNDIIDNGGDLCDVPNWKETLESEGFVFDWVNDHQHMTAYGTSDEWLEEEYPDVKEQYTIED